MEKIRSFKYKNISLFFFSLLFALLLSKYEPFHLFLLNLGNLSYIGAFIAGILFVSTFTVATAAVVLLVLAEQLSAIEIGILAGLGAVLGDFTIFRFIKDNLMQEITLIYDRIDGNHHFTKVLHSKYFSWTLPVIGAVIIASPLPDEVGVSLMGIAKMKTYKFLLLSFILNATGIFLVISASSFIKP
ncbi:MAG: hypothetical protein HYV39_00575 [Candidatus Levybacteria bacterium]|nr:hypothetical protein [Candidatus Levybacteria bacterium]